MSCPPPPPIFVPEIEVKSFFKLTIPMQKNSPSGVAPGPQMSTRAARAARAALAALAAVGAAVEALEVAE